MITELIKALESILSRGAWKDSPFGEINITVSNEAYQNALETLRKAKAKEAA
jgi:hypothetical protein